MRRPRASWGRAKILGMGMTVSAMLLPSAPAEAYTLKATPSGTKVYWASPMVEFTALPSGGHAKDELLASALAGAAEAWGGTSALAVVGVPSGGHPVRWSGAEWQHDPEELAIAFVRYEVSSGHIQSAEIVINEPLVEWRGLAVPPDHASGFDLQNTLTHELGHALGIGHSETREAIMYATVEANTPSSHVLFDDDIAAVLDLYGSPADALAADQYGANDVARDDGSDFGCTSVQGAGGAEWFLLFIFAALVLRARASRRVAVTVSASALMFTSVALAHPSSPALMSRLPASTELVIEGRIIGQHTEWRPGDLVVTVSRVQIDRCLFGACPRVLWVVQLGGEYGDLGLLVSGVSILPNKGRVILATRAEGATWRLAGENRGQAYVEAASVGREGAGASLAEIRGLVQALIGQPEPLAVAPEMPTVAPTESSSTAKGILRQ